LFPFENHQAFEVEFMKYFCSNIRKPNQIQTEGTTMGQKRFPHTMGEAKKSLPLCLANWESGEHWGEAGEKLVKYGISHFISQADYSVEGKALDLLDFIFNTCSSFKLLTLSRWKRVLTASRERLAVGEERQKYHHAGKGIRMKSWKSNYQVQGKNIGHNYALCAT
jgi:hypothetical protein